MYESSSGPVGAYVARQASVILDGRGEVLANSPDAIHQARIACRRLRTTLRVYHALWLTRHRDLLRDLRWYGRQLGAPRDTEVIEGSLLELSGQVFAPGAAELRQRLRQRLDADREAGLAALSEAMASPRFETLMRRMGRLAEHLDWDDPAEVPAVRLLPALAYAPVIQVALRAGRLPESGDVRYEELHELRKQAKAARYAYEAIGDPGKREAGIWRQVTMSFGHVQDVQVGLSLLDELEPQARVAGEAVAAYDNLRRLLCTRRDEGERAGLDALARAITEVS